MPIPKNAGTLCFRCRHLGDVGRCVRLAGSLRRVQPWVTPVRRLRSACAALRRATRPAGMYYWNRPSREFSIAEPHPHDYVIEELCAACHLPTLMQWAREHQQPWGTSNTSRRAVVPGPLPLVAACTTAAYTSFPMFPDAGREPAAFCATADCLLAAMAFRADAGARRRCGARCTSSAGADTLIVSLSAIANPSLPALLMRGCSTPDPLIVPRRCGERLNGRCRQRGGTRVRFCIAAILNARERFRSSHANDYDPCVWSRATNSFRGEDSSCVAVGTRP